MDDSEFTFSALNQSTTRYFTSTSIQPDSLTHQCEYKEENRKKNISVKVLRSENENNFCAAHETKSGSLSAIGALDLPAEL